MKAIIAYFSATNVTRDRALEMAKILNCDTLRIMPEIDYTHEDLNWLENVVQLLKCMIRIHDQLF